MSIEFTVDNSIVNVKATNLNGSRLLLYKGEATTFTTDSLVVDVIDGKYNIIPISGGNEGEPIEVEDVLEGVCRGNNVSKNVWIGETTTICVIAITETTDEEGYPVYTVKEISNNQAVSAPIYAITPALSFDEEKYDISTGKVGVTVENDETKGIQVNIANGVVPTSTIAGITYSYDLVRVCDGNNEFETPTHFTDITLPKRIIKSTTITETEAVIYDPATQFKATSKYYYMLFVYPMDGRTKLGNGTLVGNIINAKIDIGGSIITRAAEDLYREDEVARIVAAENAAGVQRIATKVFPKIGTNGGNVYTILLKSSIDLSTAENMENIENVLKEAGIIGDTDGSKRTSYTLSGIGKIDPKFNDYYPTIKSTGKITLVKS